MDALQRELRKEWEARHRAEKEFDRRMRNMKTESKWTAVLCTDPDETVVYDLFGDPVKLVKTRSLNSEEDDKGAISVCFKISKQEYDDLCRMANNFGMSNSRYCRDAVRKILNDHKLLIEP